MADAPETALTEGFRLATSKIGPDVWLFSLTGDGADLAAGDLLRQFASLPRGGHAHAVVDLTGATALRSSLFRALLAGARSAREGGVSTIIVSEDSEVRRALGGAETDGSLKLERGLGAGIREALTEDAA